MWIFGYGSLVWKVDFPYIEKLVGYIKGYDRRFWQASIDHRGTPEKPGRVVTLVPSSDPNAKVWGTAYKIDQKDINEVLRHLDRREVMGYMKVPILFQPVPNHPLNEVPEKETSTEKPFSVTMYYGSSQNEHYLGDAPLDILAKRIWEAEGPSGTNKDYLFNLIKALKIIKEQLPSSHADFPDMHNNDIIDSHLTDLEAAVNQLGQKLMHASDSKV